MSKRARVGVDASCLLVLEFDSINLSLRDVLEERFQATVVDETKEKREGEDFYRCLAQFPDQETLASFQREITAYEQETEAPLALPPGLRLTFFDALQEVRLPSRVDRIGPRLEREGLPPADRFFIDVDLWHPGSAESARKVLDEFRALCGRYGGRVTDEVRTKSLILAKVEGSSQLADILLDLDLVASVDLPPRLEEAYANIFRDQAPPDASILPDDSDPLACVVDSGVISGHPFLLNWVIEEADFESGEATTADLHGHGTSVAGIVVYGDIAKCLAENDWRPRVRICSAKVLRRDVDTDGVAFPDERRVEHVVDDAVRYFAVERNCRVFNLSIGSFDGIYRGGRQFPWAEKLDELARELDVVIVISAGNRIDPPIPNDARTREELQKKLRDQLMEAEQRVCNPATACLALTVGSIARSEAVASETGEGPRARDSVAASPSGAPSPFSRTGPGYGFDGTKTTIKPDLVQYGGNFALQEIAGGEPRWIKQHVLLGEPTIQIERDGRFVGTQVGTSFSAPHIAHAAAIAEKSLENALGASPPANLVRALVASAAVAPPCGEEWLVDETSALRLVGYGFTEADEIIYSKRNHVRLVAFDQITEDHLHIYRIPVPEAFLQSRGERGIAISLAYDPPVRSSRREYLARTIWFDLVKGLDADQIEECRARYTGENPPSLPQNALIEMRPTKTETMWSTLQVRRHTWKRRPVFPISVGETEPALHLLVGCQQRFPTGLEPEQGYGLVVVLWHEAETVELYQHLRARVRTPAVRVRV